MKLASFTQDVAYNDSRPAIQVMLNTDAGKEIRIAFKKGQIMKEHQTPFPIVVQVFRGTIDFGVRGEIQKLAEGDMIALEGGVPHDLTAMEDSLVRLSLSTADSVKRVKQVVEE